MLFFVYGLRLEADAPIPGLIASSRSARTDVRVHLGLAPSWLDLEKLSTSPVRHHSPYVDEAGEPFLTIRDLGDGWIGWRCGDGTTFVVDRSATEIWASWPPPLTVEDTATYLLGPVLGFLLRLRGVTSLHASAVRLGDGAVVFVGAPGAGKSTLAAAFAQRGCSVLTDDVAPLSQQDGRFLVQPGYPRVRLWPQSPDGPLSFTGSLPKLTPNWDKRYLDLSRDGLFQQTAVPVSAIYLLQERSGDFSAPLVASCSPVAAMIQLLANVYAKELLDDDLREKEFTRLAQLVETVPVRVATPHADPAALGRLCDCIVNDLESGGRIGPRPVMAGA